MSAPRSVLAAFIVTLALSFPAVADPTLNLEITDNIEAGDEVDLNGAAGSGFVDFSDAIGAWNVGVATGIGSNDIGSHHLSVILDGTSRDITGPACVDSSCSDAASYTPPLDFLSDDAGVASNNTRGNFTMTIVQSFLLLCLALAMLGFVRSRRKP